MAMLRVPYNNAMRLGQGVNSFTQQLCMLGAVEQLPPNAQINTSRDDDADPDPPLGISQIVSYSTRFVSKVSDIAHAMNVSAALSVKTGGFEGNASGKYVNTDKFKESDLNFFIQVKDTFISGWEEGGEFNALISIKLKDKSQETHISGRLEASIGKGAVKGEAEGSMNDTLNEAGAETIITVNWSGGGQLKPVDELWTVESMTKAAANFPELVAMTPQRKYAILTKYTNLSSFQQLTNLPFSPLDYENAGIYSSHLLELFSDYKTIWKNLQLINEDFQDNPSEIKLFTAVLSADVKEYLTKFQKAAHEAHEASKTPASHGHGQNKTQEANNSLGENSSTALHVVPKAPFVPALPEYKPYPPSIIGIIDARHDCRLEMVKIVNEVDEVTRNPGISLDSQRVNTFLNPAVFKMLIPVLQEKDPFYSGNPTLLPGDFQQALASLSARKSSFRMSELWTFPQENSSPPTDILFNDMDGLVDGERAIGVRVGINHWQVASVTTYWNSGRASHHEAWTARPDESLSYFNWDPNVPIQSVQVEGSSMTMDDGNRARVTTIIFRTRDKSIRSASSNQHSVRSVQQCTAPTGGWEFAGFWGYKVNPGFSKLGVVWTKIKPMTIPAALPLYDDDVQKTMPRPVLDSFANDVNVGRWIKLSPLNGDAVRYPGGSFSSHLGDDWKTRGTYPCRITFFCGTGVSAPLIAAVKLWYPVAGDRLYPNRAIPTDAVSTDFNFPGGEHRHIDSVKVWAKKIPGHSQLITCYVEVHHTIPGKASPFVGGTLPVAADNAVMTTMPRPPPLEGKSWHFAGFYGANGDLVDNLGVVWAREDKNLYP